MPITAIASHQYTMANNPNMLRLMTGLGYSVQPFPEDPDFKLVSKAL